MKYQQCEMRDYRIDSTNPQYRCLKKGHITDNGAMLCKDHEQELRQSGKYEKLRLLIPTDSVVEYEHFHYRVKSWQRIVNPTAPHIRLMAVDALKGTVEACQDYFKFIGF